MERIFKFSIWVVLVALALMTLVVGGSMFTPFLKLEEMKCTPSLLRSHVKELAGRDFVKMSVI